MARRRKKDPIEALLRIVPPIGFALVLGWNFSPQFRQALGAFAVLVALLAGGAAVVALGVIVWRLYHPAPDLDFLPDRQPRRVDGDGQSVSGNPSPRPPPSPPFPRWSLELLRSLDWKRYEDVVAAFAKHVGHIGETTRIGADGGIDIHIYEPGNPHPVMIVQCKAWESYKVGVKPIRELYGVMAAEQVKEGAFFTTSDFTQEAREFAEGKQLDLVTGTEFLRRIAQLPEPVQTELFEFATMGDYTTPTCPSCGVKMISRVAKTGNNAGNSFWGCRNYPRCKRTFQSKAERGGWSISVRTDRGVS